MKLNENKDNYNYKKELLNYINKTPNNNNHIFSISAYYTNINRNNIDNGANNEIVEQNEKNVKTEGIIKRLKKYNLKYVRKDNDNINKIKETKDQQEDNKLKSSKKKIDREIKYIKNDKNKNNGKHIIMERNKDSNNKTNELKQCKSNNDIYKKYKI